MGEDNKTLWDELLANVAARSVLLVLEPELAGVEHEGFVVSTISDRHQL